MNAPLEVTVSEIMEDYWKRKSRAPVITRTQTLDEWLALGNKITKITVEDLVMYNGQHYKSRHQRRYLYGYKEGSPTP
jgi:hypothetical protein